MSTDSNRISRNGASHPFTKKEPKPTRQRLVSLLDPLGRKRYGEVERFLATVNGSTSGLFYYGPAWGWAVRYLMGVKNTLCTLHLLPNSFEATVMLGKEDLAVPLAPDLKRKVVRAKVQGAQRCVRLPIKNDHDYANFKTLVNLRADALRAKKPGKAKPEAAMAGAAK